MQELVAAYGKVYPNLTLHATGYPDPDHLLGLIKVGNIDFEGAMDKDTEGSDFIKSKLLDDDMTPLYLQVWGGTNTIARALKAIEDTYKGTNEWPAIYKKVCDKAVIYAILDQDATYRKYISIHWKDIRVFYNSSQFWCLAYNWKKAVPEPLHYLLEGDFMGEKIINDHGPLTKLYYSYGDGQIQAGDDEHIHGDPTRLENAQWGTFKPYDFISEGDSPAFLHLIDVGLDNLDHPEYGGWGGRLAPSPNNPLRWEDGEAVTEYNPFSKQMDLAYAQVRWLEAIQNDFAARADWCIKSFQEANHPPQVQLKHNSLLLVAPGQKVKLKGKATDPDGDQLSYKWWPYQEVGTYAGEVSLEAADKSRVQFTVPADLSSGQTIHLILEVTDGGPLPLHRYERVILQGK
jgi:hypothetical protein